MLTELQQRTKKKRAIGRRRTIAGSAISQLNQSDSRPSSASKAKRTATPNILSAVQKTDASLVGEAAVPAVVNSGSMYTCLLD